MKWEKTITAVKKTRLTKPKTVALVGLVSQLFTEETDVLNLEVENGAETRTTRPAT